MSVEALSSVEDARDQNREFARLLEINAFDFIDFGCSIGGSIEQTMQIVPGARGLGIDIDSKKIEAIRSAGHDALEADARYLRATGKQVRFAVLSHFLEHLPAVKDANLCLRSAAEIASEFVMVRQPSFDADGYLFGKGLKTYWSDWHGHPNRMTSLELQLAFEDLLKRGLVKKYGIYQTGKITNARHNAIHPLASPQDQGSYDQAIHPAKKATRLPFTQPVFKEVHAIADLDGGGYVFDLFAKAFPGANCLYVSP